MLKNAKKELLMKKWKISKIILICTVLVLTLLLVFLINHLKDDAPLKVYDVKDIPNLNARNSGSGTGVVIIRNDSYISIAERFNDSWVLLRLEPEEGFTKFSNVKEGDVVYYEAKGPVLELYPGITKNVYRLDILGEVEGEVLKKIKEILYNELHFKELR